MMLRFNILHSTFYNNYNEYKTKKIIFFVLYSLSYTVEPLLSGHPRGNGKWPLNGVGRLIGVRQELV